AVVPVGDDDLGVAVVHAEDGVVVTLARDLLDVGVGVDALFLHAHDRILVPGRRGCRLHRDLRAGVDLPERFQPRGAFPARLVAGLGAVAVGELVTGGFVGGGDDLILTVLVRVVGHRLGRVGGGPEPDVAHAQFRVELLHRDEQGAGVGDDHLGLVGPERFHGRGVVVVDHAGDLDAEAF